ncbi:hypothetical protein GW17_00042884 [Ensete ventricosum]|nr:hypothetical protein GW17_00042884 [Ensete ventricosum]
MRLNHVELFYALVAAIGNESRRCLRGRGSHMHVVCMQRWLAMARPPAGVVGQDLANCKGRSVVARPAAPARGDACGQKRRPRGSSAVPARECRPRPALLPAGARRQPQGWLSLGRVVAGRKEQSSPAQGQRRRRRRGGKERARASF